MEKPKEKPMEKKRPFRDMWWWHKHASKGSSTSLFLHFPMLNSSQNHILIPFDIQAIILFAFCLTGSVEAVAAAAAVLFIYNSLGITRRVIGEGLPLSWSHDKCFRIFWRTPSMMTDEDKSFGISLDIGGQEDNLSFMVYLWGLGYYGFSTDTFDNFITDACNLGINSKSERKRTGKLFYFAESSEIGFSISKEYCYISFFHTRDDSEKNRWYSFYKGWDTDDILYGKLDYGREEAVDFYETGTTEWLKPVMVASDEYGDTIVEVKVTYDRITHNRPLWKEPKIFIRTNLEINSILEGGVLRRFPLGSKESEDCVFSKENWDISYGEFIHHENIGPKFIEGIQESRDRAYKYHW